MDRKQRPEMDEDSSTERKTWQVYNFGKNIVLSINVMATTSVLTLFLPALTTTVCTSSRQRHLDREAVTPIPVAPADTQMVVSIVTSGFAKTAISSILPVKISIYRGQNQQSVMLFCWTSSKDKTNKQTNNNKQQQQQHTHTHAHTHTCLLYTSPSPRDDNRSRMPSSA